MLIQSGVFRLKSDCPSETKHGSLSTFTRFDFPCPFLPGSKVAVLVTMQTFNGCHSPGLRVADVTPTGFKIRENEIVAQGQGALSDGVHLSEGIAWLAFVIH